MDGISDKILLSCILKFYSQFSVDIAIIGGHIAAHPLSQPRDQVWLKITSDNWSYITELLLLKSLSRAFCCTYKQQPPLSGKFRYYSSHHALWHGCC